MIDVVMDVMMFMFDNGFFNNRAAYEGTRGTMWVSVAASVSGSDTNSTIERRIG